MTTLVDGWGLWLAIWLMVGLLYAAFVRWVLAHRRFGAYWQENTWLFVVIGCLLVAFASWSLCGCWQVFAVILIADTALGMWQIAAALVWNAVRRAQSEDERDVQA